MKALVLVEPGVVKVKDVQLRQRNKGEALIKVKSVSVCGSDISAFRGKGVQVPYPLVLGHEIAGIVEEIDESDDIKVGDHVILSPYISCGECYPCSIGRTNCCETLKVLGVQVDGAMSEYFIHPANLLYKVPEDMSWDIVPIIEPLVIALHGLHSVDLKEGEHVVIIGAGPIGLLAAMVAIKYNSIPIIIDIIPDRLNIAKELGIVHAYNSLSDDVITKISEITKGRMAETVLEMSGSSGGIKNALNYASYCGRIGLTGWPTGDTGLDTSLITRKELTIKGSRTGTNEFIEAIDLILNKDIDARAIVSSIVDFNELPDAIRNQSENPNSVLKVVATL